RSSDLEASVSRIGRYHVKSAASRIPIESLRTDSHIGQNLLLLAVGEVVQNHGRRSLLIKGVAQALGMGSNRVFSITRGSETFNPVQVGRQAGDFFVFHADFVEPHGRLVVRVFNDFGIILLLFQLFFVERWI